MDHVKFELETYTATKNQVTKCKVTVTPLTADKFTLTLEILGEGCYFVSPSEKNQKSVRTFKSNGFMQPRECEMDLVIGTDQPGTTVTVLTAYTKTSNKPEVKLTIADGGDLV